MLAIPPVAVFKLTLPDPAMIYRLELSKSIRRTVTSSSATMVRSVVILSAKRAESRLLLGICFGVQWFWEDHVPLLSKSHVEGSIRPWKYKFAS